jgi:hypothetical protein
VRTSSWAGLGRSTTTGMSASACRATTTDRNQTTENQATSHIVVGAEASTTGDVPSSGRRPVPKPGSRPPSEDELRALANGDEVLEWLLVEYEANRGTHMKPTYGKKLAQHVEVAYRGVREGFGSFTDHLDQWPDIVKLHAREGSRHSFASILMTFNDWDTELALDADDDDDERYRD